MRETETHAEGARLVVTGEGDLRIQLSDFDWGPDLPSEHRP
ncbi:hypothetical protein [Herbidospora daliensis]|nr:hypothetical protein [Herbidospora daliensis]